MVSQDTGQEKCRLRLALFCLHLFEDVNEMVDKKRCFISWVGKLNKISCLDVLTLARNLNV